MSEAEVMTLRPATAPQVFMACIGVPFVVLGLVGPLYVAAEGNIPLAVLSGFFCVGLGGWCLLEISTVRVHLTAERLWLTRFWHTRWTVDRSRAKLQPGRVGDGGVCPGLKVIDTQTRVKVGEIISVQFNPKELARLKALLDAENAVRR